MILHSLIFDILVKHPKTIAFKQQKIPHASLYYSVFVKILQVQRR